MYILIQIRDFIFQNSFEITWIIAAFLFIWVLWLSYRLKIKGGIIDTLCNDNYLLRNGKKTEVDKRIAAHFKRSGLNLDNIKDRRLRKIMRTGVRIKEGVMRKGDNDKPTTPRPFLS